MNPLSSISRRGFLTAAAVAGAGAMTRAEEPAAARERAEAVNAAVERAMKEWRVPGACVGVVRDGAVAHLRGYGVRQVGTDRAVTPGTLFGIGSCTKAFAAATAAILVDDRKLAWDDPVRKHLPWFHLSDPLAERELTLRDCLCHRTGLHSRHELLYYRAPWNLEENVRRAAHLELSAPFRSVFHYSSLNYFIAALVIAAAAGKPWHEFARERLLTPLGMTETAFTRAEWQQAADRATTHLKAPDGSVVVIPPWNPRDDQIDAGGRIKASGRAMCAWLRLQLAGGRHGDRRVISEANLRETQTPQMVIPRDGFWADAFPRETTVQWTYALGWKVRDYRGHAVLSHAGRTDGFSSEVVLAPGARLGFVILTNLDETWMPEVLMHTLLDLYLGLPRTDWNEHYRKVERKLKSATAAEKAERASKQKKDTKPTLGLKEYVGTYSEPAYGEVQVAEKGGRLQMTWSSFTAELKPFHHDTFTATGDGGVNVYNENPLDGEEVVFVVNGEGRVGILEWYGRRFKRAEGR